MSHELIACPFCGGDADIYRPYGWDSGDYTPSEEWQPRCSECGCEHDIFKTQEEAAAAWNTRVTPPPNAPSMTMQQKIARYSNVVDKHGPDSTEARKARRLHPGDTEFHRAADSLNSLHRFLGINGYD